MFPVRQHIVSAFSAVILATSLLSGCAKAPAGAQFNDPFEQQNRAVHAANLKLDQAVVRPSSKVYSVIPAPVQQGISNFGDNFATPGMMVNALLQGDMEHLVEHTFRFAINTTFGIGGLLDAADAIGLHGKDTDFGQTLHVWGVGEGPYVELPFYGPSTVRDTTGLIVYFALNPLGNVVPKSVNTAGTVAKIASKIGDRGRYSDTVDSILYESADSYAQARILYLQNRRFELGEVAADDTFDPYEDPYAQ